MQQIKKDIYSYKTENIFESIRHIDEAGKEYWNARELQQALQYKEWRKFEGVIEKAKTACNRSQSPVKSNFVQTDKIVKTGISTKNIKDLGGTMPEDLPTPDKSIKQLKKDMKISNTESLIENK